MVPLRACTDCERWASNRPIYSVQSRALLRMNTTVMNYAIGAVVIAGLFAIALAIMVW